MKAYEWGHAAALYVGVMAGATIAVLFTDDAHRWWLIPLTAAAVPTAMAIVYQLFVLIQYMRETYLR